MTLPHHDGKGAAASGGGSGNNKRMTGSPTLSTIAGRQFELRPIRASDAESYDRLVSTLSPEDRRYRFFSAFAKLPPGLRDSLTNVDHTTHEAFVAAACGPERCDDISGVVRMIMDGSSDESRGGRGGEAEYAIIVSSRLRGVGLGYSLMQYVIDYARYIGLERLRGDVMTANKAMLQMCRELGFEQRRHPEDPSVSVVTLTL